jgi:hypothetical protein
MGTLTIDPKETESFLLMQDDVMDASVWLVGGLLRAHVTLAPGAKLDEPFLKSACQAHLGLLQTPLQIELIAPMRAS